MEHDSDDDVLILWDETDDQIKVEPAQQDTEDLFRQIDEALAEEPPVVCVKQVTAPSQPAGKSSRLKRAFTPVQAPDRGMPRVVTSVASNVAHVAPNVTHVVPNVTITPMVAGTSRLNANLLQRLGPVVTPLASRLGPPSTSVAPVQSTPEEEVVEIKPTSTRSRSSTRAIQSSYAARHSCTKLAGTCKTRCEPTILCRVAVQQKWAIMARAHTQGSNGERVLRMAPPFADTEIHAQDILSDCQEPD